MGMVNVAKATVAEKGFFGLYKGYLPNFVKVVPTIAIMFWTNDMLKRRMTTMLRRRRRNPTGMDGNDR